MMDGKRLAAACMLALYALCMQAACVLFGERTHVLRFLARMMRRKEGESMRRVGFVFVLL